MDQQNPNDPNSSLNPGSSGDTGSGGMSSGPGYGSGGTGTGMSSGGGMTTGSGGISGGGAPIGVVSGSDADTFGTGSSGTSSSGGFSSTGGFSGDSASGTGTQSATADAEEQYCTHCGHSLSENKGLEQFLGRLGISGDMFSNLKGQFQNVDIDEYLNTAREYLKGSSTKVTNYTKENPAKVAAGVAALALGAGLIYAAVNRDKTDTTLDAGIEIKPDPNADLNRGGDFDRDRNVNRGYDPNRT